LLFHSHTPPITFHLAEFDEQGVVQQMRASQEFRDMDQWWVFHFARRYSTTFRKEMSWLFNPSSDSSSVGSLWPYKYEGFLARNGHAQDRQVLEEMIERGDVPWQLNSHEHTPMSQGEWPCPPAKQCRSRTNFGCHRVRSQA